MAMPSDPRALLRSRAYLRLLVVAAVLGAPVSEGVSLSSFRGGPVFPALFTGAAGGILPSHLPGLPLVAGVAMGIGRCP